MIADLLNYGPAWTAAVLVAAAVLVVVAARRERTAEVTELDAYRRLHPHCGHHPGERRR